MDAPPIPVAMGPYPSRFMPFVARAVVGENTNAMINNAALAAENRRTSDLMNVIPLTPLYEDFLSPRSITP
jgi:hypothetical protein